jgi:DNA replication protein DnaC
MRDAESKAEWQSDLSRVSILFIDDVDKLKPSEGLMELVFAVLDDRLSFGRPTILTTNLTGNSLAERWGEEVGPYLVRRIRDFCLTVDFDV